MEEKRIEAIESTLDLINQTIREMIIRLNTHFDRIQMIEKHLFDLIHKENTK